LACRRDRVLGLWGARARLLATVVVALVVALPAAAGGADAGFGNGGWLKPGGDYNTTGVEGIAVRPNGRIVLLGEDGWLQQRLSDGRVDKGFRAGEIGGADQGCGCAQALALQPDGKVLTEAWRPATLARYTATGRLDTSFGDGGELTLDKYSSASGPVVAQDGRIVVGVTSPNGMVGWLLRFLPDGRPDASFGSGGTIRLPDRFIPAAVTMQPDGGIVAAGDGQAVARYRSDGSRDSAFAPQGTGVDGLQHYALTLQPDGKIVVAGVRFVGSADTDVARLLPDGRLDTSFGAAGVVVAFRDPHGSVYGAPAALATLPDGGIAIAGAILPTCSCKGADWLALRVTADGTVASVPAPGKPDPDHDCDGGTTDAVAAQPDGKILFGGGMCDRGNSNTFVGRFNPNLTLDAGPALQATLTGVHARSIGSHVRLTGTLRLSDAATVTVTVKTGGGTRVQLLPGSRLGTRTRTAKSLLASFAHATRVPVVLLFATRPQARYLLSIDLADDRSRAAHVRLTVHPGQ